VKTFRFNLGFAAVELHIRWKKPKKKLAIQKYQIATREVALDLERCLLLRVKQSIRGRATLGLE
jgi:hypothetical protein